MSKKANPTTIGLFFVLGAALGIAGLLVFSSRSLFHPQHKDIVYFNASLKGLNPGAPVKFRGVTIGSVVEILIRHNQASDDFAMPVVIAIDKKLAQSKSDQTLQIGNGLSLDQLIHSGLRARLDSESLVTGVLYVELEIVHDAPAPVYHQLKREYLEIPSVPSNVEQLLANLSRVDLGGISEKLNIVLARLDANLAQLNLADINAGVTNLLGAANRVVAAPDLTNSLASLKLTLDRAGMLVKRIDSRVDPLADSLTNTLAGAQKTLTDLRTGVRTISDLLGPDSSLRPGLNQALDELGNAGQAVAELADFLKRNPNALLVGKKPKEQP